MIIGIASQAHLDLSGIGADDHHVALHDLATHAIRLHSNLQTIGSGDHHTQLHASVHGPAGGDALRLDNLEVTEDNTDLNFTTLLHGLVPKGTSISDVLRGDGTFGDRPALLSTVKGESRTAAAASGNVSYTGAGFAPTAIIVIGHGLNDKKSMSWGFGDDADLDARMFIRDIPVTPAFSAGVGKLLTVMDVGTGNSQEADLVSLDADGATFAWVKVGTGEGTNFIILYLR